MVRNIARTTQNGNLFSTGTSSAETWKLKCVEDLLEKNGVAPRKYPYYLILCPYDTKDKGLYSFYENPDYISIPVEDLDMDTVSFTYGDSFVQYYHTNEKPEIVYTYDEILKVIHENGWAVNENGWGFVEAHLWSDEQISKYRKQRT